MINGISSSLATLSAYSTKLSVAANNLANFTTDGYKRTEAIVAEDNYDAPEATLRKIDAPGPTIQYAEETPRELSNVDLSQEVPQMMIAQRAYEANLKALQVQSDMFKTALDILV